MAPLETGVSYLVTAEDLVGEGLPDDGHALAVADLAEALIERCTGGFRFTAYDGTLTLDGNGAETLVLPQPIVSLTSVTVDSQTVLSSGYVVLNRRPPAGDDRRWPRLCRVGATWTVGRLNVALTGRFGFTDLVGSAEVTPPEIKRAALALIAMELNRVGIEDEAVTRKLRAYLKGFSVEGVSVSLADAAVTNGHTGVPEIDKVLAAYRHRGLC